MKSLNRTIIFLAILGVFGAGLLFFTLKPSNNKTLVVIDSTSAESQVVSETDELNENIEVVSEESESSMVEDEEQASEANDIEADTPVESDSLLTEKSIGDVNAPMTIIEFSSLSCGHCGTFHTEVYPDFKKNFIETGKVRLIMVDFPLNLPALRGAMLAHCLPEDQYFNFLQLLFTTQSNWNKGDYAANLKQNAQLAGLSSDEIEACIADTDLEEAIIARMEDSQAKWNVNSTPSFVVNNGAKIIEGAKSYNEFIADLNSVMDLSSSSTSDPDVIEE